MKQDRWKETIIIDIISLSFKRSQMPTLKQLLYLKGEKTITNKRKDRQRLLRSPYNYWSMHRLYQSNLWIFTALMDTIIPFPIINALCFQKEIAEVLGKVMCNSRPSIVKNPQNPQYFKFPNVTTKSPSEVIYFDSFCWGILLMGTYTLSPFILKKALLYS